MNEQWFWEQCGWHIVESKTGTPFWHHPLLGGNRWTDRFPIDIDLNNLFKYAVPVLLKKIGKYELAALVNNAICDAVDAKLYGQEGIPDHLFRAIYKAFGGE